MEKKLYFLRMISNMATWTVLWIVYRLGVSILIHTLHVNSSFLWKKSVICLFTESSISSCPHYAGGIWLWRFISIHTNSSWKRSFWKTLFKPEALRFKTRWRHNDHVISLPEFPQTQIQNDRWFVTRPAATQAMIGLITAFWIPPAYADGA